MNGPSSLPSITMSNADVFSQEISRNLEESRRVKIQETRNLKANENKTLSKKNY